MPRKTKQKKEKVKFSNCEICDTYPAMWRWYNGKIECSECATRSFKKYLAALAGTAVIIILGILIF